MIGNITIEEIKKIQYKKEEARIKIYNEIYGKCCQRIKHYLDKNLNTCYYSVPLFKIGYPLYDVKACTCYLILKIRKAGLDVTYYSPNILYINWENQYLKKRKKKEKIFLELEQKKTKQMLPLTNVENYILNTQHMLNTNSQYSSKILDQKLKKKNI